MMNTNEVHVHPLSATDPLGYLPCRVAHSRKVMKGEDKSFASPGVQWRGVSFDAFGLFDGHGGKDAAEHCADRFVPALIEALDAAGPSPPETDPEDVFEERIADALVAAFATVDQEFLGKDIHSGATATIVCVNGRRVHSAAVGDSLATLDCGHGVSAVRLTPEHRLDTSAAERKRIEDAGGEVRATAFEEGKPVGPLRVWPGGLAVSRSIGDRDGKRGGVSSEPEISSLIVPDSQPGFRLVLASDGLWDAVTVKQAAQCGGKLGTGPCAAALCKLAQKQKDNRDDITVLVADYLAGGTDKSPLTNRPPWKTELEVQWPLGRRRYDPVPCASARRSTRMEGEAEAERVEREAIEAARARARDVDETTKANARRLAELEEYTRSKASGIDDGGWEEVGGKGGKAVEAQEPKALSAKHNKKEKKDAGKKNKATSRPDHAVTKKVPTTNGGRGTDSREGQRGGRGGRGGRDDVAVAMDGLNIDPTAAERSSPKPPPKPRAQPAAAPVAEDAVDDVTSAPAAPTSEATDSPTDARSPIKKKSRKGKKERAAERAAMEADAAAAAEKLPPCDEPPAPPPPQQPQAQQSQVDHRALLELQYRAMAEMHAQHQYMMQQRDRLAHGNGHDSPPRMAHPGLVGHHSPPPPMGPPMGHHSPPPHFIPPHMAQHVPGVHHGAPGPAPPLPPGSPGPPTPAAVPGSEDLNSSVDVKPKQKRKGKRERAMERARLAAAETTAAGGSGAASPVPPGGPPPPHVAAMMMGHQRGPPPGIPPGMAPMAGWHPGMIHPPPHLSMPPGPWQGH
jgi:serine/threonine protein phosphatase PrpC